MNPHPYIGYPKERSRVYQLWERFQADSCVEQDCNDDYEKMLFREWRRCQELGVNIGTHRATLLANNEYQRILKDKSFLLQTAQPILHKVCGLLSGVPGILIFADNQGTILYVEGDASVRSQSAQESNLVEGSCWLESLVGTNGIGTAISKKSSVHVYSPEHYCEGWHKWTCAASPVHEPFTQEILGVVDFTTLGEDFREDAVGLTYSLASHITTELRLQLELERIQLIYQYSGYASRFPSDTIVVLDRMGNVVRKSSTVNAEDYKDFLHNGAIMAGAPKEIRQICLSGTETEIGTLLVVGRTDSSRYFLPTPSENEKLTSFGRFVTVNKALKRTLDQLTLVVPTDLNVLLIGETGTGKELIASYIHNNSPRRSGPYVTVNCGAISKELCESKFFGYERGAFTGADTKGRKGLFECASGGTLFLDEIGELPIDIQAALLRVLETGKFRRLGSEGKELSTDCRIIAATNRLLSQAIRNGSFRSDLYYRLSVAKFEIAPLRERPEDIPALIEHTMEGLCLKHKIPQKSFTPEAMEVLSNYSWPGNGREIRNIVEAAIVCAGDPIDLTDLPTDILNVQRDVEDPQNQARTSPRGDGTCADFIREQERQFIVSVLAHQKPLTEVAKSLGVSRGTLYRKLESLGIRPRDCRRP